MIPFCLHNVKGLAPATDGAPSTQG